MNQNVQKIYVDVDEEITTVIDRLKHSPHMSVEIIVPQHALLLQSVVNLKLLLQESKRYGKKMLLVTNDEEGMSFAERAGINVKYFVSEDENVEHGGNDLMHEQERYTENRIQQPKMVSNNVKQVSGVGMNRDARATMDMGGNANAMNSNDRSNMGSGTQINPQNSPNKGNVVNKVGNSDRYVQKVQAEESQKRVQQNVYRDNNDVGFEEYEQVLQNSVVNERSYNTPKQNLQNNNVSSVSKRSKIKVKKRKKQQNPVSMPGTSKFILKGFIGGVSLILIVSVLVIILPKTSLEVEPKQINIEESMDMTSKAEQSVSDADRRIIPARAIERDITFTKTFNATGTGNVKAQKAQGTITILNEFSNSSQPLVATTRFLAEDGTLFRLVKATTVPGMSDSGPGSVEALVIADKPGSESNIGPIKFSIPGFSSGPKRDKIYATSDKAMVGGGTGGNGVSLVTEEDIATAEKQMTDELEAYIKSQMNGLLRPDDEILLDENIKYEVLRSEPSLSVGTMADQFMYEIVSSVEAMVFSQKDVISVMGSDLTKKYSQYDANKVDVNIQYDNTVPNFEDDSVKMNVKGTANIVATVDIDSFREDIKGKKHDELLGIIEGKYKDEIEKIVLESVVPGFPVFVADHISNVDFMTDIEVR